MSQPTTGTLKELPISDLRMPSKPAGFALAAEDPMQGTVWPKRKPIITSLMSALGGSADPSFRRTQLASRNW